MDRGQNRTRRQVSISVYFFESEVKLMQVMKNSISLVMSNLSFSKGILSTSEICRLMLPGWMILSNLPNIAAVMSIPSIFLKGILGYSNNEPHATADI
jgi:hypothetical protein